jgi:hypothetical protein
VKFKEEYKLRIIENRVLSRFYGPRWDETKRGCRKLHNEKFHNMSYSRNAGCFKKSFTASRASIHLFRRHKQCFELLECSKAHQILRVIVKVERNFYWQCRVFQESFMIVFHGMCGQCYENIYTDRLMNYPSFKMLKDG